MVNNQANGGESIEGSFLFKLMFKAVNGPLGSLVIAGLFVLALGIIAMATSGAFTVLDPLIGGLATNIIIIGVVYLIMAVLLAKKNRLI